MNQKDIKNLDDMTEDTGIKIFRLFLFGVICFIVGWMIGRF